MDLADPKTLIGLGAIKEDEPIAAQWRDEWLALPRPIVPDDGAYPTATSPEDSVLSPDSLKSP